MKKRMSACVALAIMALLCVGCPISISRYSYEGWLWNESRLGDEYEGTDIWQLSSGDYFVLASLFGGDEHAYCARLSATGNVTWSRRLTDIDGTGTSTAPPRAAVLSDDSIMVAGMSNAEEGGNEDRALRIEYMNAAGARIWQREFGGFEIVRRLCAASPAASSMVIGSFVRPYDNGAINISPEGNVIWQSQFPADWNEDAPIETGAEKFSMYGICASSDGGAIMCGEVVDTGFVALLKMDAGGELEWFQTYVGVPHGEGMRVLQADDGCYVVGAEFDVYVEAEERSYHPAGAFKVDADGNLVWKRDHLTPNLADADEGHVHDMEIDQAGNIIIVGELEFNGPTNPFGGTPVTRLPYICKLSGDGDLIWFKTMENPGHINGVGIKNDGGYVTAGITGNVQLQVIHFDTNGNIVDVP